MSIEDMKRKPMFVRFVRETIERFADEGKLVNPKLTVNLVFEHPDVVRGMYRTFVSVGSKEAAEETFSRFLKPRAADLAALAARFSKKVASVPAAIPTTPKPKMVKEPARKDPDFDGDLANSAIPEWVRQSPERVSAFNGFINMPLNPNDKPSLRRYEIPDGPAREFLFHVVGILRGMLVASGKNPDTDKSPLFKGLVDRIRESGDAEMGWLTPLLPVPGLRRVEFVDRVEALSDPNWDPKKARANWEAKFAEERAGDKEIMPPFHRDSGGVVVELGVSEQ